ncbi:MAG: rhodanese-like domain-containing protein [Desulfobulbales bacterium]|nr:rhodanese-like domain-containing protein [Desulfobulbales bacterium]
MINDDEAYVLVDLRSKEQATIGHIKGAVSIPEAELAAAKDSFPKKKSAPIILYNAEQASAEVFALVRGWGYKNTTVLKGGAKAWDGKFFSGDPGSDIVYVKKLKPGEISIEEFKKAAAGNLQDTLILDVRDSGMEGYVKGALDIPQAQLADRLAEIPRDKEIIIHCNTGILAAMAYKTLTDNGYKARYLDAVVQVAADSSLEVTEK